MAAGGFGPNGDHAAIYLENGKTHSPKDKQGTKPGSQPNVANKSTSHRQKSKNSPETEQLKGIYKEHQNQTTSGNKTCPTL